jgi:hypothetical protein
VPRVGRIIFQLPSQPGDVRVDRAPAHCGASPPYLAKQFHAGSDCTASPHQREKEAELRTRHSYRFSIPQHRLGSGLQEDAAEANRSSQSCGGTGGKATGSSQQLLHSRDQLAYDRRVRVSGTVQFTRANEICVRAFDRKWSGDLKLMNDRPCFFVRIERFGLTELRCGSARMRLVSRFVLIVDDEDSRNASIVGAPAECPGSCVVRGMSVPTPAGAELLESYDRRGSW